MRSLVHADCKLMAALICAALGCAAVACATVADLDVTREATDSGPHEDLDDAATGEASADAPSEGGGADAPIDSLAPPAACACTSEQACCVPQSGAGMCTPPTAAGDCASRRGIFVRCAGSDVANGRVCCFSTAGTATYYAASCQGDAGPQLCADTTECSQGTCQPIGCRGITLSVCAPTGAAPAPCPP